MIWLALLIAAPLSGAQFPENYSLIEVLNTRCFAPASPQEFRNRKEYILYLLKEASVSSQPLWEGHPAVNRALQLGRDAVPDLLKIISEENDHSLDFLALEVLKRLVTFDDIELLRGAIARNPELMSVVQFKGWIDHFSDEIIANLVKQESKWFAAAAELRPPPIETLQKAFVDLSNPLVVLPVLACIPTFDWKAVWVEIIDRELTKPEPSALMPYLSFAAAFHGNRKALDWLMENLPPAASMANWSVVGHEVFHLFEYTGDYQVTTLKRWYANNKEFVYDGGARKWKAVS